MKRISVKIGTALLAVLFVFTLSFTERKDPATREIQRLVDSKISEIANRTAEFTSLGADPSSVEANVSHAILCSTSDAVSFMIKVDGNGAPTYGNTDYYNIDPVTGEHLTLEDVFGPDFCDVIWERLRPGLEADRGIYGVDLVRPLINRNRMFYFTDDGKTAVIVFGMGEIAPDERGIIGFPVKIG